MGSVAVGGAVARWFEVALRLDGRYDSHPADELGSDDSLVGDPRLAVRVGDRIGGNVHLGAELGLWVPGQDAPSVDFGASTLDASALLAWRTGGSGPLLAMAAGWRMDNTSAASPDVARTRVGDRISLGLSDFDAVVLGIGAVQCLGPAELLAEVSGDLLVGSGAPPLAQSPWRAAGGARLHVGRALDLEVLAHVALSERPGVAPDDPLIPIEPRFAVTLGLGYRIGLEKPKPAPARAEPRPAPPPAKPAVAPPPPPPPPPPATCAVTVNVLDEGGRPIPRAYVTITVGDSKAEVETGADGKVSVAELPCGPAGVAIEAEGFEKARQDPELRAETPTEIRIDLVPAVPAGQLRGLIRSFEGRPLVATIRVEPGGMEAKTDAEGRFELDVPPGNYTITIEAEGHLAQRRAVRVENRGVTILNADLKVKP
jgi:hypothetical protein